MTTIPAPYPYFTDAAGNALEAGKIYIGTAGLDPRTNPIAVYQDEALTIAWAQPIRTVGGYPVYIGAPSNIHTAPTAFSIIVTDKNGGIAFRDLNASSFVTSPELAASSAAARIGKAGGGTVQDFIDDLPIVTPQQYGALADDVTNDQLAFSAALDFLIAAGGGTLFVPAGTYRLTSQIAKTLDAAQSITIKGEGRGTTTLDFSTADTLGLQFTSTSTSANHKPQIEIDGLSIVTSNDNCGSAIRVSYADANNFLPSVTVSNVYISGNITRTSDTGSGFGYWTRGIYLTNARNSRVMNAQIAGEINKTPFTAHAVYLDGECTATQVIDSLIMEGTTGVEATGTTEGISVINSDILYCRYGVRHNITSGGEPQCTIIGGSINCANVNVWLTNSLQSVVSGVLMYAAAELDSGTWPEWTGVRIDGANSRHNKINGCTFSKSAARTGDATNGIDFNQGSFCSASGNTFEGFSGNQLTYGVLVRSGFNRAIIGDDNVFAQCATRVVIDPAAVASNLQPVIKSGATGAITTGATVTFPQAFPNTCLSVIAVHSGTNTAINVTTSAKSASGFVINFSGGGSAAFDWVATGE